MTTHRSGNELMRRMFGRASDEVGASLAALDGKANAQADEARAAREELEALKAKSIETADEIAMLKLAITRLERQLQWVAQECEKTGTALFERIEASRPAASDRS